MMEPRIPAPCIEALENRIAPAAVLKLGNLDGHNGFNLTDSATDDVLGGAVGSAGDMNGDGFDDLLISARAADPNGEQSGAVYVLFGKADGFDVNFFMPWLDGGNGFKISGAAAGDFAGSSAAGAGDVNGDGFDDIIVGAFTAYANANGAGAAYVVFGKATGFAANLNLSSLDGTNGFKLSGAAAHDFAGVSVDGAGDVNDDGFDDVIVGADTADSSAGAAYVVFGKDSGFAANLNLSALDGMNGFKLAGAASNDLAGRSVSGAGDVNGDGFADVIVGAPFASSETFNPGAAYVVFGKSESFAAVLNLGALDGTTGFKLAGAKSYDNAGSAVSGAGDVNGDGFADIVVGAPGADPNGSVSGASYVIFGKAGGFAANLNLSRLDGTNGFKLSGAKQYDRSGSSVSHAGDVNGDGFGDIVVGAARGYTALAFSMSYVVFGKPGGYASNLNLNTLNGGNGFILKSEARGDDSGRSVSGAGDINGDGLDDLIIGAPYASLDGNRVGKGHVVFGQAAVQTDTNTLVVTEPDGDIVTVKVTARVYPSPGEIVRGEDGSAGIDLTRFASTGKALTLNVSTKTPKGGSGDGQALISRLEAPDVHFASIVIDGTLQEISAGVGAGIFNLIKLTGNFGAAGLATEIRAAVGILQVGGNLVGKISADDFKKVIVNGNIAGGALHSAGRIGSLLVRGDILDSEISALGMPGATSATEALAIGSVKIGGDFARSKLLAGFNAAGIAMNADVTIGAVTIGGNFEASSLVAGATAGSNGFFGDEDDQLITGGGDVIAKIASVAIKGSVLGSTAMSDHFGIVAEEIGKLKVGSAAQLLTSGPGNDTTPLPLGGTADVKAREVG
jgi:hypothetical protein